MPQPGPAWRARLAAAGLLGVLATAPMAPTPAQARPVQVEDILQREGLGAVVVAPGDRWLLVEQRGPYASASRFDYQLFNGLFRTRLMVADLRRPGPLRPLFRPEPGVGYQLGPISPDGERAAIYRLRKEHWELGVATIAARRVRWFPLTPELPDPARALQWISRTQLVGIVRAPGDQPFELRWNHAEAALPARWAATERGARSVTVVGSGRELGTRRQARPKTIVRIDAVTGQLTTLATGAFEDLEISPTGRHLALLEAGPDIALSASHEVQGAYGIAVHRLRLVVLDLVTGVLQRPTADLDILANLMTWAPKGEALLVFGRSDGVPWTAGRLLRVDADTGVLRRFGDEVRPSVEHRPEVVYAGWWGSDPIVFGRRTDGGRADWFRLGPDGPINLTGALAVPPREGLVLTGNAVLLAADAAAWRLGANGQATRLSTSPFSAAPHRGGGAPTRTSRAPRSGQVLRGLVRDAAGQFSLEEIDATGTVAHRLNLPVAGEPLVFVPGRSGALVEAISGGGREDLEWRTSKARVRLATLNRRFADIDTPQAVAIPHRGPNGETLKSWMLLPSVPITAGKPPPLIVAPYLGTTFPTSPAKDLYRDGPVPIAAALLGHGYAVLFPSLPIPKMGSGPGEGLAARVLQIVDLAAAQPGLEDRFDAERLGLWGHSFGGYSTLEILTQTSRFKAAVSQAAVSDLVSQAGVFAPGRRIYPDEGVDTYWQAGWVEDLQGGMHAPIWKDPSRYLANSPVFHANQITTPLMIVHGDQDNMGIGQAEEMFSALFRQNKDGLLVTYWGEKHLYASPGNLRDLDARIFAWFDSHLLGRTVTK